MPLSLTEAPEPKCLEPDGDILKRASASTAGSPMNSTVSSKNARGDLSWNSSVEGFDRDGLSGVTRQMQITNRAGKPTHITLVSLLNSTNMDI
jgi:hypothetical protein